MLKFPISFSLIILLVSSYPFLEGINHSLENAGYGSSTNIEYKVLCLTRHSSRGISFVNAQEIALPNNIILPNPFIAWDEDLSEAGARLIQIKAINQCIQEGFDLLKLGKWGKKWDEIRVDFLYQRTFLSGKILKEKIEHQTVPLTGVIDKENSNSLYLYSGTNYDSLSYAMLPGTFDTQVPSEPSNIDPAILQEKTGVFLNWLNLAIHGQSLIGELPPVIVDGKFNSFYSTNITIATDLMIMLACPKAPLNTLFKNKKFYPFQEELVRSACDLLGYTVPNLFSTQYIVYNSFPILQYLNQMSFNEHGKIIMTHDIRQLQLLKALNIESNKENIPFQSYIFIRTKDRCAIMYTAPKITKKGRLSPSVFTSKVIWMGSSEEWDQKIENMTHYVDPNIPLYPVKEAFELIIN